MSTQKSLSYELCTNLTEKGKMAVPVPAFTDLLPEARLPPSEGTRPIYQTNDHTVLEQECSLCLSMPRPIDLNDAEQMVHTGIL